MVRQITFAKSKGRDCKSQKAREIVPRTPPDLRTYHESGIKRCLSVGIRFSIAAFSLHKWYGDQSERSYIEFKTTEISSK